MRRLGAKLYRVSDKPLRAFKASRREGSRPLTALAKDYPAGCHVPKHRHRRGQLVYAASGVGQVTTRDGIWTVPPQRALWLPPGVSHEVRMLSDVAARTLYLDRTASAPLGPQCKVLFVSRFLRELVLEAVRAHEARDVERLHLMTPVLLSALSQAKQTPVHIPVPSDSRLKKICKRLLDDPSRKESLELLAYGAGVSSRTLARLFQRELKMTFGEWRQQVRLAKAVGQMAVGDSVKKAAAEAGYRSCSAFSAMFRRTLGIPPTRYWERSVR